MRDTQAGVKTGISADVIYPCGPQSSRPSDDDKNTTFCVSLAFRAAALATQ